MGDELAVDGMISVEKLSELGFTPAPFAGDDDEHQAATLLQGKARQKSAKKLVDEKRAEKAAAEASAEVSDEHHEAATKLQGVQRQKQAKAKVEAVRQEKAEQAEKDAAITKIQGVQRQKTAKKKVEAVRAEKASANGEMNGEAMPADSTEAAPAEAAPEA